MRQVTELACFKFNFNLKLNVNLLAELIKEQTGGVLLLKLLALIPIDKE